MTRKLFFLLLVWLSLTSALGAKPIRKAGGVLDVRVLNPLGAPVKGVWVRAWPAEGVAPRGPAQLGDKDLTDSKGRIRLAVPEAGIYKVEARIWIETATASTTVHVLPGPDVTPVELRLSTGFEVSGRVVGENGAGIPGADIILKNGTDLGLWAPTKPDGSFIFPLIADGGYRLEAQSEEFRADPLDVTVAGGPVQGLELRLRRHWHEKGRASLTVRIQGLTRKELSKVEILAFGKDFPSYKRRPDRYGRHRFAGLLPGSWEVIATAADDQARGTVQIPDEALEATLDLVFPKYFTLTGRVLVDGTPLSGGSVRAQNEEGYEPFARTAHDGTFTLGRLTAGPVTLRVTGNQGFAGLQTVQLTKNQKVSISLATGSLAGRVLTATGEPVRGAWVILDAWPPARNNPMGDAVTLTHADGAFAIPRLGAGTYKIRISQEGFAPVETTAEVPAGGGSAPVAVVLKPQ